MKPSGDGDAPLRVALVGLGKIARDRHVPALGADGNVALAATVDPAAEALPGVPHFASIDELFRSGCAVDAAAICTPPQVRHPIALQALAAGKHVLLEKPPAAALSEMAMLQERADAVGVTLFAAWHSRYAAGVIPAREWLGGRNIRSVQITWREDVRVWHPGQLWIWQPGGFGVFDPGINALSIATAILPHPLRVRSSTLQFPANCEAPVAAQVVLEDAEGLPVGLDLDFLQTGPQTWDILVETDAGQLCLSEGGRVLRTPDGTSEAEDREYAAVYRHFEELVRTRTSHADCMPLRLVADAFLLGRIERVGELTA